MGIDMLDGPKLIRWAIKSSDLKKDQLALRKYHPAMGDIRSGSRQTASGDLLKWELIMPLSTPEVEVVPFVLDWSHSTMHPTEALPSSGFRLHEIQLKHPDPKKVAPVFEALDIEVGLVKGETAKINAVLISPNGLQVTI